MFLVFKFIQSKAMHRAKNIVYQVIDSLEINMSSWILQDGTFLVSGSQKDMEALHTAVNQALHETLFPRSPRDTIQLIDTISNEVAGRIENFTKFLPCKNLEEAQTLVQKLRTLFPVGHPHFEVTICRTNSVKVAGDRIHGIENLIHNMENISIK